MKKITFHDTGATQMYDGVFPDYKTVDTEGKVLKVPPETAIKIKKEEVANRFIDDELYVDQWLLVEELLKTNKIEADDIHNVEGTGEVSSWWACSDYIAKKLIEHGECVIMCDYGCWWGRTESGQDIKQDGIFQELIEVTIS